jgi:hypothetical protein
MKYITNSQPITQENIDNVNNYGADCMKKEYDPNDLGK